MTAATGPDAGEVKGRLLQGKVAIVTGVGGRLGREQALRFAREGARLVVHEEGRRGPGGSALAPAATGSLVEDLRCLGCEAVAHGESLATLAGARALVELALERFGGLDVVVTNLGTLPLRRGRSGGLTSLDAAITVQLKTAYACVQAAAQALAAQGRGGRIVTVSASPTLEPVCRFTAAVAMELRPLGISVNALAIPPPRAAAGARSRGPAAGLAQHVAEAALYLATELGADITGATLLVGGDRLSIYRPTAPEAVSPVSLAAQSSLPSSRQSSPGA